MTELDAARIINPILNSPYFEPSLHWPFDEEQGVVSGEPEPGRRPSSYLTPIPGARQRASDQYELGMGTGEQIKRNELINDIRGRLKAWRSGDRPWDGVTPTTRRLLEHWAVVEGRERPLFFAQREAIETAIWLTEVAPKEAPQILSELAQFGEAVSDGLPRIAHKMATGTGKTVLMGLIIAWQTLNKARNPKDARFSDQFLVVAPGITIRDRLRVLSPSEPDNYYDFLHLVPAGFREELNRATVVVTNYHAFMLRQKEKLTAGTKAVLGKDAANFTETEAAMVARVLRPFGKRKSEIVVLNDEAHHCYRLRPENVMLDPEVERRGFRVVAAPDSSSDRERRVEDEDARVWHSGLTAIHKNRGIKTVYDLSATPFYISGSGWPEGTLFQWVVSDFPLIEAVEAGIVKIPRVPVRDDVDHDDPAFRALWSKVGEDLRRVRGKEAREGTPVVPAPLEAAFRALYSDYRDHFEEKLKGTEDDPDVTPPVFIVVADSTDRSTFLFRWLSGWKDKDGTFFHGVAPLFDNVQCDHPEHHRGRTNLQNVACSPGNLPRYRSRPLSVLVDSDALDRPDDQLPAAFAKAAQAELERFRSEFSARNPGSDPSDAEILREVMNTVGKAGRLGGPIRLVVSVSMLTEGWDANTVTHVLGVRAFSTQLICEQVVGRALRRVSYEIGPDGRFPPEYADVYGVPWKLIPTAGTRGTDSPPNPSTRIYPVPERTEAAEIRFPRVIGYRVQPPGEMIELDGFDEHAKLVIDQATWAEVIDLTGKGSISSLDELKSFRVRRVHWELAHAVTERMGAGTPIRSPFETADPASSSGQVVGIRPWLFPQVLRIVERWMGESLVLKGNAFPQLVMLSQHRSEAVERILGQIARAVTKKGSAILLPILDPSSAEGSTAYMQPWSTTRDPAELFLTREDKCQVNRLVSQSGWERSLAQHLESMDDVDRYAKNEHLDFTIPYVIDGIPRSYLPDFIFHLDDGREAPLQVVLEVSGRERRDKGIKTLDAATKWTNAINAHGGFGRWAFVEITEVDSNTPNELRRKAQEWIENHDPHAPPTPLPRPPAALTND